jgi:lipopolysaccharide export system protein LptA
MKWGAKVALIAAMAVFSVPPNAAIGQARGSLLPGATGGGPINIEAGKLDYFDKEQKLVYGGGVTVRQGGSTLKASAITIFMAADSLRGQGGANSAPTSQIRRMEAAGPVTITSQDQVGSGDRGVFDRSENRVRLVGNVTLTRDVNVQKCDELVYDLASNVARCIGNVRGVFTPGSPGMTTDGPGRPRSGQR